jgi:dienelactone hydrolase
LRAALGSALRGFATGGLVVALGAAGYAGLNLHLATPVGDALLGILLVGLPILLAWGAFALAGWLLRQLLRPVGGRTPGAHRAVGVVTRATRATGHPLVASTLVITAMLTLIPDEGPLAMYRGLVPFELLVAAGALVGLLIGIGRWAMRPPGLAPMRRAIGVTTLTVALILGSTVAGWAAFPGFGDAVVREDGAAVAAIPELDLADPSGPGAHEVVHVAYGSGNVWRRPEFGSDADWRTPTVDASAALADRDAVSAFFANLLWGHDDTALPMNGLAWYPAQTDEPMPVALIVHGNHAAGDFSDPGYAYLGEHLASHGILAVSVDQNFLNGDAFFDYGGAEQGVRAWMVLRHLAQIAAWNDDPAHPLAGRVDLDRVALIGHSRGGEAVSVAAALEAGVDELHGLPPVPRGFGIRAVVGIAPSDGQYAGPGAPIRLTDLDYLTLQGAHDGDLPAFTGLTTYHRVAFTGSGDHLKVALYSQRANHGRFNTVWDVGDAGPLSSWLLDRGSILSPAEQQQLAKGVIGAFLQRSLFDRTEYDAFFRDPRAGRAWLPEDVVQTEWATSERTVLDDFISGPRAEAEVQGFDEASTMDPGLRDGTMQGDRAIRLTWTGPAQYRIPVPSEVAAGLSADDALVLSIVAAADALADEGPIIHLVHADGRERSVVLDEVSGIRPLLPTRLWKLDALGARYLPEERLRSPIERFLQTYEIPLSAFDASLSEQDLSGISGLVIRFTGTGSAYLDDIAFEPLAR